MGILTNINDFTPVTPESPGTTDVVVVGPDPYGISAADINPHSEVVWGDFQDLLEKPFVLLEIN